MRFSKNEKGMTLIEIIVATAVFSVACATLFTAILFALKQNKENYFAGNEIQMQMNSAERYDSKKSLLDNKVVKYRFSSNHSNKVSYQVDFRSTHDGTTTGHHFDLSDDNVYAYMAIKGTNDTAATYQMRFFEPENTLAVDPDEGKFWVNFYNYSSTDLQRAITVNEGAGATLYNAQGDTVAHEWEGIALADTNGAVSLQIGLSIKNMDASKDEILVIGEWNNEYFSGEGYALLPGDDFLLTRDNLDDFCEKDGGNLTGYINIYYDGSNFYNAAQMEAKYPGSTGY